MTYRETWAELHWLTKSSIYLNLIDFGWQSYYIPFASHHEWWLYPFWVLPLFIIWWVMCTARWASRRLNRYDIQRAAILARVDQLQAEMRDELWPDAAYWTPDDN